MSRILLLDNPIRPYAWGSRRFLAELQGRPVPTSEPEAELWIGAHPAAPSRVVAEEGPVPLADWIARDPGRVLGRDLASRSGGELPFLVKILAVEAPLSVQVHPDAARARAGFERESAAGIPPDAPHRRYRDPRPKPELLRALTPFEALVGLRPAREVRAALEALEVPLLAPLLEALEAGPARTALRRALAVLLGWPAAERPALGEAVAAAARRRAHAQPAAAWVARLAEAWPGDPAALAPCFLHPVRLAPGEALFVPPGTLHTYLSGAAVELQASSDNVLRAGLTRKHVDVAELLRVARLEAAPQPRGVPLEALEAPGEGAELRLVELRVEGARVPRPGGSLEILVCVEGRVEVAGPASGARLALTPGAACLVPASAGAHELAGRGRVLGAGVPAGA